MLGIINSVCGQKLPAAGIDAFLSSAKMYLDLDGDGEFDEDGIVDKEVTLIGPVLILREDPGDKDNDKKRDIATEILSLELEGRISLPLELPGLDGSIGYLRLVAGSEFGTRLESPGMIEELEPGAAYPAHSFFDVSAEVELAEAPGGPVIAKGVSEEPVRMETVISTIPPFNSNYKKFSQTVFVLEDPAGNVIKLVATKIIHTPKEPAGIGEQDLSKLTTTWGKLKSSY
jgi:hypothetical protein